MGRRAGRGDGRERGRLHDCTVQLPYSCTGYSCNRRSDTRITGREDRRITDTCPLTVTGLRALSTMGPLPQNYEERPCASRATLHASLKVIKRMRWIATRAPTSHYTLMLRNRPRRPAVPARRRPSEHYAGSVSALHTALPPLPSALVVVPPPCTSSAVRKQIALTQRSHPSASAKLARRAVFVWQQPVVEFYNVTVLQGQRVDCGGKRWEAAGFSRENGVSPAVRQIWGLPRASRT